MQTIVFSFNSSLGNAHEVTATLDSDKVTALEVYCKKGDILCEVEFMAVRGRWIARNPMGNDYDMEFRLTYGNQLHVTELHEQHRGVFSGKLV